MSGSTLPLDPFEAEMTVYEKLRAQEDYASLSDEALIALVRACLSADARYIDAAQVLEGGVYDDEAAYGMILETLQKEFPGHKALLPALADDFMEHYEAFLEAQGVIDWD